MKRRGRDGRERERRRGEGRRGRNEERKERQRRRAFLPLLFTPLSSLHPLIPRPALFSPLLRKDPTRKHRSNRSKDG